MRNLFLEFPLKVGVILTLLLYQTVHADQQNSEFQQMPVFLPVDEAFKLTANRDDDVVNLYWQISPGYYLYKHKVKVGSEGSYRKLTMLPGIEKVDEYFGEVEVYYEQLDVDVSVGGALAKGLLVEFQGCADAGICYPPRKVTLFP